jgi:hypothetical protein
MHACEGARWWPGQGQRGGASHHPGRVPGSSTLSRRAWHLRPSAPGGSPPPAGSRVRTPASCGGGRGPLVEASDLVRRPRLAATAHVAYRLGLRAASSRPGRAGARRPTRVSRADRGRRGQGRACPWRSSTTVTRDLSRSRGKDRRDLDACTPASVARDLGRPSQAAYPRFAVQALKRLF